MRLWPLATGSVIAAGLWFLAALNALPITHWPTLPWHATDMTIEQILLAFGLVPRAAVALLVGALLGLAGALMQAVLRNPLADPTTLGTAAGAQLAIVMATVFAPGLLAGGNLLIGLCGAAVATLLVMTIGAQRNYAPVTITITGMLVGMLASAVAMAVTLAQGHYLLTLVLWNGGALTQNDFVPALRLFLCLLAALVGAALLARPLTVMSLGAEGARGLGLKVVGLRSVTLCLAVLLSAFVSAEVGLVGFVGLAAPAIARSLGARTILQRLIIASLSGALLLSLTDNVLLLVAAFGGPSLPTGALTGLIGGPLLIWLLPRMQATVPQTAEDGRHTQPRSDNPVRLLSIITLMTGVTFVICLFTGRGPEGWNIVPSGLRDTFLPIRATVLVAAASAGALLAISGAVLQRLTANPMAAPEVLGVTGGSALGYAATVFLITEPSGLALALGTATGGALALVSLSIFVLRRDMAPARILLAGLAIGALASAVLMAIMASSSPQAWSILGWLAGSASSVTSGGATILATLALALLFIPLVTARWLEMLPLGTETVSALGLPVRRVQFLLIMTAGLATGAATTFVGPVSFVGLMAPHLARSAGLVRPRSFLLASWMLGALLMVLAAFGARTATYPYELPIGLFATLIGVPWLFILLLRKGQA
ncbi:iron complex transport system permease protein [Rhizobium sp. BIGb0125]|uniref:Fe(3+)-hydroxamate ABC transporter permease FhuB n=1 Tax=Rhizobium sp. BIGb0125 TaxID=2940618 RepID=UPI0021694164|nr:Fe(3+)-hydroxamate ABC transporter permease FhuB [Rhizobium sp. BIGb0125]MCS4243377.1 iron complex transport system permease protein [Rhizobium sp. BIGb0125]